MQLQGAIAVCVRRHDSSQCDWARIVRRLPCPCFCATSLSGKGNAPRGKTVWAELLLDAAAQNGVNSSTLSVATWWLQGVVGLSSLALKRNEARALREYGDGLQLLRRTGFRGVGTFLLERNVQGFFRSNGLCVVVVANRDNEANDR